MKPRDRERLAEFEEKARAAAREDGVNSSALEALIAFNRFFMEDFEDAREKETPLLDVLSRSTSVLGLMLGQVVVNCMVRDESGKFNIRAILSVLETCLEKIVDNPNILFKALTGPDITIQ